MYAMDAKHAHCIPHAAHNSTITLTCCYGKTPHCIRFEYRIKAEFCITMFTLLVGTSCPCPRDTLIQQYACRHTQCSCRLRVIHPHSCLRSKNTAAMAWQSCNFPFSICKSVRMCRPTDFGVSSRTMAKVLTLNSQMQPSMLSAFCPSAAAACRPVPVVCICTPSADQECGYCHRLLFVDTSRRQVFKELLMLSAVPFFH